MPLVINARQPWLWPAEVQVTLKQRKHLLYLGEWQGVDHWTLEENELSLQTDLILASFFLSFFS